MRFDKRGQGATEYLLMLAAVLVIVAIAVYYVTSTGPSAIITGTAVKNGDNINFTPSSTMVPSKINAGEWEYAVYRGATAISSWQTVSFDLERGIPVALSASGCQTGDLLKIRYKGNVYDAATVS
ncbi:MAG: class III signal peptide-containing protein [Candidatus Hadarchaeum sp.]|uniref:class III signal peptide-containing protein n=1 Tax=Candidatus Hadarchaeum sp. TaxID=2883567 RepID=UPI00317683C5